VINSANTSTYLEGGLRTQGAQKQSTPEKPLISVITVVFNGAKTLRDTIESVILQSYENIEHIVLDGGSTDGTVEILQNYNHQLAYWRSEKDGGIYDAMNKGIALATGEYIGMLNADDLFADNEVLQSIVDKFQQTSADAVFSCLNIVDQHNLEKIIRKYRVAKLNSTLLRIGVMPAHPTFYCKKSCYQQAGLYKTDYKIAADFEMLARLCLKQQISWAFLNKVTVTMRAGGVSTRGLKASIKLNLEIIRACKENDLYSNFLFLFLKIPLRLFELIR
jgi:glycosyltransferase involved in cell wall biosynthesis